MGFYYQKVPNGTLDLQPFRCSSDYIPRNKKIWNSAVLFEKNHTEKENHLNRNPETKPCDYKFFIQKQENEWGQKLTSLLVSISTHFQQKHSLESKSEKNKWIRNLSLWWTLSFPYKINFCDDDYTFVFGERHYMALGSKIQSTTGCHLKTNWQKIRLYTR